MKINAKKKAKIKYCSFYNKSRPIVERVSSLFSKVKLVVARVGSASVS